MIYATSRDRNISRDAQKARMRMAVAGGLVKRGGWNRIRPSDATLLGRLGGELPGLTAEVRKDLTAQQITDCERQAEEWLVANPSRTTR